MSRIAFRESKSKYSYANTCRDMFCTFLFRKLGISKSVRQNVLVCFSIPVPQAEWISFVVDERLWEKPLWIAPQSSSISWRRRWSVLLSLLSLGWPVFAWWLWSSVSSPIHFSRVIAKVTEPASSGLKFNQDDHTPPEFRFLKLWTRTKKVLSTKTWNPAETVSASGLALQTSHVDESLLWGTAVAAENQFIEVSVAWWWSWTERRSAVTRPVCAPLLVWLVAVERQQKKSPQQPHARAARCHLSHAESCQVICRTRECMASSLQLDLAHLSVTSNSLPNTSLCWSNNTTVGTQNINRIYWPLMANERIRTLELVYWISIRNS